MSLFRKRKQPLPALFSDEELSIFSSVNYESVLDWLVGLSAEDYKKVCAVAHIYREANQAAAAELGAPNHPTSFIMPPVIMPSSLEDVKLEYQELDGIKATPKKVEVKAK